METLAKLADDNRDKEEKAQKGLSQYRCYQPHPRGQLSSCRESVVTPGIIKNSSRAISAKAYLYIAHLVVI